MIIDYLTVSDAGILLEIGERLKRLRLNQNLRQTDLVAKTGLSLGTIKRLENGQGGLANLIILLRGLGALEQLDSFIPPTTLDPVSIADMQGKIRQRAGRRKV